MADSAVTQLCFILNMFGRQRCHPVPDMCLVELQKAEAKKVTMELICLAGNHSSWAAQELLKLDPKERLDKFACEVSDKMLKFRTAWLFCRSGLNDDIVHILQGTSFQNSSRIGHFYTFSLFFIPQV